MKNKLFIFLIIFNLILLTGPGYSQEFEMPSFVHAIDACDMDMDGSNDIIVSCGYIDTIAVLFNDGYGNFEPYYYGRTAGYLLCGCIDGDSIPDIVTTTSNLNFIKNNGDRTLEDEPIILINDINFPMNQIIDMNNDGLNDLFYQTNAYSKIGIMQNNGNLIFTNRIIYSGNSTIPSIGSLNTDNLPDFVVSFPEPSSETFVYMNNGNFNFSQLTIINRIFSDPVIMESNNSEPEDLTLFETPSANVYFYENCGNPSFEFRGNNPLINVYAVEIADHNDYDNDWYSDICYCQCPITGCNDSVYIALNSQNWSYYEGQAYYVGTLNWFRLISTDLNSDSYLDLLMTGYNSNNLIKILWNQGDGTFADINPVMILENETKCKINLLFNPNPFSNNLQIGVKINQPSLISIKILDLYGQVRSSIVRNIKLFEGEYLYHWNGSDFSGSNCPPGIYIVILYINGNKYSQKIIHY